MPVVTRDFFAREAPDVARNLLGHLLVHESGGQRIAGRIVEAEGYTGWDDAASHASRGQTKRNAVMFGPPGHAYVYFIYGMYWLLNVAARPPGVDYGGAALIRAVEPVEGIDVMAERRDGRPEREWTSGPGRLTMALGVDGTLNGVDLTAADSPLRIERGQPVPVDEVACGPRIGLGSTPEPWRSKPWRFWVAGSIYVSR